MNRLSRLLFLLAGCAAVSALAQTASTGVTSGSSTVTTGSGRSLTGSGTIDGPGVLSAQPDPATLAIPSAIRAKTDAAHASWIAQGGAEFSPHLNYAGGAPILMLMVPVDESPATQARRLKAMVQSCEYMVADGSFDHAVVCIATYDPRDRQSMATRNTTVRRDAFQAAVGKAGHSAKLPDALTAAYHTPGAVEQICAELGIR